MKCLLINWRLIYWRFGPQIVDPITERWLDHWRVLTSAVDQSIDRVMICYCWRGGPELGRRKQVIKNVLFKGLLAFYVLLSTSWSPQTLVFHFPLLPSWSTASQAQKQQNQLGMDCEPWNEALSISSLNCLSGGFATSLTNMAWVCARQQIWPQFPALSHTLHHRGILVSQQTQHWRYYYNFQHISSGLFLLFTQRIRNLSYTMTTYDFLKILRFCNFLDVLNLNITELEPEKCLSG